FGYLDPHPFPTRRSSDLFIKPANYYYKIVVSDNGIGFDDRQSQMIFELFQRLKPMDGHPGTGIGLAICKKIVENHHGFIQATGKDRKSTRLNSSHVKISY